MAMNVVFQHSPKQLDHNQLIDSRSSKFDTKGKGLTKPRHETDIIRVLTSKYMSISRTRGDAYMISCLEGHLCSSAKLLWKSGGPPKK